MKDEELEKYIGKKVALYFLYVSDKPINDKDCKPCIGILNYYYQVGIDRCCYSCKKENNCELVFISGYVRKIVEIG